ncbi:unnamed protein product [Mytilus coruscus]|uniref:Uncharacterized protein n=1 Tax=Mytilus coruscus TaxID=42192 RepID=A0A6J8CAD1_MYTCO|nr:unnamed protein product [Mytilus coruscus]
MFGWHPRLVIDAFIGNPNQSVTKDHTAYVSDLKKRLQFAYKTAEKSAERTGRRHKTRYDMKVRLSVLESGNRVLLKNVAFRGKNKLENKWGKQPYVIVSKPDSNIPVYIIRQEHGRGRKTVHRNMLLPITSIPILNPQCSENSHRKRNIVSEKNDCPSVLVDKILDYNKTGDEITTDDQVVSNASSENSDSDSDEEFLVHKCPRRRVDVIPSLNPLADEFHPGILNLDVIEVSQRSSSPDSSTEQSDGQSSSILGVSEFSNPVPVSSESETSSDNHASSVSDNTPNALDYVQPESEIQVRRSSRQVKQPVRFQDYVRY